MTYGDKKINYEYQDFEDITEKILDYADFICYDNDIDIDYDSNKYIESLDEMSTEELMETVLHLMDEYVYYNPKDISEPEFHDSLIDNVSELLYLQFENDIQSNPYIEEELEELINEAADIFYTINIPKRSHTQSIILNKKIDHKKIEEKINYLKSKPQPSQRTKEWYEFRHNLITASNAYKAFESQLVKNQLIFEKCKPLIKDEDIEKQQFVNTNSTLHWGQKYEPISVMIYEDMFKTKVGDFGCIKHDKYKFLGASPDGINIDPNNLRYGRMLEIKNIVNREIDGIPKKEYWIQMQLQMEVCDLDECDFLETKFVEYTDYQSYREDTEEEDDYDFEKRKGVIIYFQKPDGKPFYVYKPLDIISEDAIANWESDQLDKYESEEYGYTFIKYIYWKLQILSCVLVERNQLWFERNIGDLEELWKTIENERITGHDHRASTKSKQKKIEKIEENNCLINLNNLNNETNKTILIDIPKEEDKNINKHSVLSYFKKENIQKQPLNIIKIDTELSSNLKNSENTNNTT